MSKQNPACRRVINLDSRGRIYSGGMMERVTNGCWCVSFLPWMMCVTNLRELDGKMLGPTTTPPAVTIWPTLSGTGRPEPSMSSFCSLREAGNAFFWHPIIKLQFSRGAQQSHWWFTGYVIGGSWLIEIRAVVFDAFARHVALPQSLEKYNTGRDFFSFKKVRREFLLKRVNGDISLAAI